MDEKYKTYIWRKAKKLYLTQFAPLLSLFSYLAVLCIRNNKCEEIWSGGGGQNFFPWLKKIFFICNFFEFKAICIYLYCIKKDTSGPIWNFQIHPSL